MIRLPKAILFDIGDTLLPATPIADEALARTAQWLADRSPDLDAEGFIASYRRVDEACQGPAVNHLWALPASIFVEACRISGIDRSMALLAFGRYRHEVRESIAPDPSLSNLLGEIRRRGIKLGVVSNGTTAEQVDTLEMLGVSDCFETVAISEDVGVEKPDPQLFVHALSGLSLEAGSVWFVGNDYEADYEGSAAIGMTPVLVGSARPGVTLHVETVIGVKELLDRAADATESA